MTIDAVEYLVPANLTIVLTILVVDGTVLVELDTCTIIETLGSEAPDRFGLSCYHSANQLVVDKADSSRVDLYLIFVLAVGLQLLQHGIPIWFSVVANTAIHLIPSTCHQVLCQCRHVGVQLEIGVVAEYEIVVSSTLHKSVEYQAVNFFRLIEIETICFDDVGSYNGLLLVKGIAILEYEAAITAIAGSCNHFTLWQILACQGVKT